MGLVSGRVHDGIVRVDEIFSTEISELSLSHGILEGLLHSKRAVLEWAHLEKAHWSEDNIDQVVLEMLLWIPLVADSSQGQGDESHNDRERRDKCNDRLEGHGGL